MVWMGTYVIGCLSNWKLENYILFAMDKVIVHQHSG